MSATLKIFIAIIMFSILGLSVGYLAGLDGQYVGGLPVFFLCSLWAYGVNWAAYIPAVIFKTEKYYDLVGALTYITTFAWAVTLSTHLSLRALIVVLLVVIWALRLGSFLFFRIRRAGHDKRFDGIKTNPARFLLTWTLQGTWVVLTSACALMIITTHQGSTWDIFATIGLAIWVFGFSVEVIADAQKSRFRKNSENKNKFISTGLWARAQHPNYFGEIVLWIGIAIMALPILSGVSWVVLISPAFVMFLLLRVSGVPLLQKSGLKKWGDDPNYLEYRNTTPKVILKLFK